MSIPQCFSADPPSPIASWEFRSSWCGDQPEAVIVRRGGLPERDVQGQGRKSQEAVKSQTGRCRMPSIDCDCVMLLKTLTVCADYKEKLKRSYCYENEMKS